MSRIAIAVERDHPAYEGHFPARPILPGVVLLDRSLAVAAAHFLEHRASDATGCGFTTRIASAKFLSPVAPGEAVALDFDAQGTRYAVRMFAGPAATERLAMSGTFVFEVRESA